MSGLGGKQDRDMLAVWAECERQTGGRGYCSTKHYPARPQPKRCRDHGLACGSDRTETRYPLDGSEVTASHCPTCDQWRTIRLVRPDGTEVSW